MYIDISIYAAVSNGKRKPRRFSLIRLPFAHLANGSLSFVRLFRRTNGSYPFANGLNGQNRTCQSMGRVQ